MTPEEFSEDDVKAQLKSEMTDCRTNLNHLEEKLLLRSTRASMVAERVRDLAAFAILAAKKADEEANRAAEVYPHVLPVSAQIFSKNGFHESKGGTYQGESEDGLPHGFGVGVHFFGRVRMDCRMASA